jgi:hypothetical protein
LIAVTYNVWVTERDDDCWETVVVDKAGNELWWCLDATALSASNGAWLDTRQLMVTLENAKDEWSLLVVDVVDGSRRVVGACHGIPVAVAGSRIVRYGAESLGEATSLVTSDLDYTNSRAFVAIQNPVTVLAVDLMRPEPQHHL